MEDKNEVVIEETEVAEAEAEIKEHDEADAETKDTTDWKAKHDELAGRLKRAETKLEKLKVEKKAEAIVEKQSKEGELDNATLDFFELKGYGDDEEVKILHGIMKKTGMSHREAIKDEWALAKIAALRKTKEVQDATPGSTRRAGGQSSTDIDYLVAKAERTGELPKDFDLKKKVIEKLTSRGDMSIPPWRR